MNQLFIKECIANLRNLRLMNALVIREYICKEIGESFGDIRIRLRSILHKMISILVIQDNNLIDLPRQCGIKQLPGYDPARFSQHENDRVKLASL